ncbi:MAG TPA: peroxidase family protein [Actinomycetota bacterium]|nr:peroxidase family protein [Actinomycetota bacterium]
MLPGLAPYQAPRRLIDELARRMREQGGDLDHPDLPAGYTYFGQLVDHDLSFDPVSSLQLGNDPAEVEDFRTPRFDLDMLYGGGPLDMPYLYAQDGRSRGELLLLGDSRAQFGPGLATEDLPRNADGRALIGDPRNDENAILAQLHLAFLKLHNRVVDDLRAGRHRAHWAGQEGELFREAQRIVRWHYQWVVAKDFLPRVLPPGLLEALLAPAPDRPGRRPLAFDGAPFMPAEFAVAAYRFGHTLVRPSYQVNARAPKVRLFAAGPDPLDPTHLGGFRPLPARLVVDWSRFLDLSPADPPQPARRLDTRLAAPLTSLPPASPPREPPAAPWPGSTSPGATPWASPPARPSPPPSAPRPSPPPPSGWPAPQPRSGTTSSPRPPPSAAAATSARSAPPSSPRSSPPSSPPTPPRSSTPPHPGPRSWVPARATSPWPT